MTVPLTVAVVGRGFGARVVAPVFAATDGCTVVDVVSPRDPAAVRTAIAAADLVAVHAPPFAHVDVVERALDAGRAVLCDKPFGTSLDDAEMMAARATAADRLLLVNFEFRWHPVRAALRSLVRAGAVGAVEHVHWSAHNAGSRVPLRPSGWLFDAERGGGWIGAWGSHVLDFLRWTLGEVVAASATRRTTVTERPDADGRLRPCTAEDGFTAVLDHADGATVTIDTTFAAPVTVPQRVTVLGCEAALEVTADRRIVRRTGDGTEEVFAFDPPAEDPHLVPMRRWAEVVRDAVRTGAPDPDAAGAADGVAVARIMDALRDR